MVKEDSPDGNSNCRWQGKRGRETHDRVHLNPGKLIDGSGKTNCR